MAARRLDVLVVRTFGGARLTARRLHVYIVGRLRGARAAAFRFSTPWRRFLVAAGTRRRLRAVLVVPGVVVKVGAGVVVSV
jgi:hypothetical protein